MKEETILVMILGLFGSVEILRELQVCTVV
jgi:hypothetical protein